MKLKDITGSFIGAILLIQIVHLAPLEAGRGSVKCAC